MAAEDAASRTGGKPVRARRRARRAGTAKNTAAGSAVRLSTAQVGKAKNTAAGNAAPPAGGSAGQARAAASATTPAGGAGSGILLSVRELQSAPTCIANAGGRLLTGLLLRETVTVLGTDPSLSSVTCRDCAAADLVPPALIWVRHRQVRALVLIDSDC